MHPYNHTWLCCNNNFMITLWLKMTANNKTTHTPLSQTFIKVMPHCEKLTKYTKIRQWYWSISWSYYNSILLPCWFQAEIISLLEKSKASGVVHNKRGAINKVRGPWTEGRGLLITNYEAHKIGLCVEYRLLSETIWIIKNLVRLHTVLFHQYLKTWSLLFSRSYTHSVCERMRGRENK